MDETRVPMCCQMHVQSGICDMPSPQTYNRPYTDVVVLAGGLGTRLRSVIGVHPKVLAEVAGRPFIFYLLDQLEFFGFRRVILSTGYAASVVEAAVGQSYGELDIIFSRELVPLGTGGAVCQALPLIHGDSFLLMNGDSFAPINYHTFFAQHEEKGWAASMVLMEVSNSGRYGSVTKATDGRVVGFVEKTKPSRDTRQLVNAGIYLLNKNVFEQCREGTTYSLEKELMPTIISSGIYGYECAGELIDIGTPQSFSRSQEYFSSHSVGSK